MLEDGELPEIYTDIAVFGGQTVSVSGLKVVRIGGFMWVPGIARSYLLAARRLLTQPTPERLGDVVLPISYLQRHAFEVAVKNLIDAAREIANLEAWLAALRNDPLAGCPETPGPIRPGDRAWTHDLPVLIEELETDLASIRYDPPSEDLLEMAQRLGRIEGQQPDRWRYYTVRSRGGPPQRSFADAAEIPVEETQRSLEQLFARHLWCRDRDHASSEDAPLLGQLGLDIDGLTQTLGNELHRVGRSLF